MAKDRPSFDGLYSPDDTLWQINRELLIMAAGPRALLLELAHPLVARGVAEHSNFRANPLKRLLNTVRVMQLLSFGGVGAARLAAYHNHQCHQQVRGEGYDANDPELRLWVFATLVDSILAAHDAFIRPLAMIEKAAYYDDSKRMARLLGVPAQVMPPTYADFTAYVTAMLTGGTLQVGQQARQIVAALTGHRLMGGAARIGLFLGFGLLPDSTRQAFGFTWTARHERYFQFAARWSRRLRASLPDFLLTQPVAWLAYYRWRVHNAGAPGLNR